MPTHTTEKAFARDRVWILAATPIVDLVRGRSSGARISFERRPQSLVSSTRCFFGTSPTDFSTSAEILLIPARSERAGKTNREAGLLQRPVCMNSTTSPLIRIVLIGVFAAVCSSGTLSATQARSGGTPVKDAWITTQV